MLHPAPRWTFTSRLGLTRWYGHVRLLPDRVLGQWWCVDRADGTVLWKRLHLRPNTVVGIAEEVIVASEMRSDGPWTFTFGCYGLSLKTGERLWTSHGEGLWGRVVRLIDGVPGLTNSFRDTAVRVMGAECVCESGRVLDVRTGRLLRRLPREEVERLRSERDEEQPDEEDGLVRRLFKRAATGYVLNRDSSSTHWFAGPYLYLVVSEAPALKAHSRGPNTLVRQRTRFHLLTIERERGTVVQDVPVGDAPLSECRIEELDERGLALSLDGRALWSFERVHS